MFTRPMPRGFTLIELIMFIVIVSVGLAGVLTVYNLVTRNSADPLRAKQAVAVAESMLEEILSKNFVPPTGGYAAACPATCDRTQFDNVADYDGYSRVGVRYLDSDTSAASAVVTGLDGYNVTVAAPASTAAFSVTGGQAVPATDYLVVTVTVADTVTGKTYSLTGYAFNND